MPKTYLGFDVGGTNIEGGLVSNTGRIIKLSSLPTQADLGKKQTAHNVVKVAEELLATNPNCLGIGLGWPSVANVPLTGPVIKKILEKKIKLPVILNNDANLFTLAEATIGQGKKYSIVVGLTFGTGVGAGLVIDREIYSGRGLASELGHITLNFKGPKCKCGNRGCFEEYAGKRALRRLGKKYKTSQQGGVNLEKLARQGDKKALKVWADIGRAIGTGIISAINAYDPEIIILGGKISRAYPFFKTTMNEIIKKGSLTRACPIKVSRMTNAAIIGGALLVKQTISK